MALKCDNRKFTRKLDGDMHEATPQPARRCYPTSLDEVVESIDKANKSTKIPKEAHPAGRHWGIGNMAVAAGVVIETNAPDTSDAEKRLNQPLYDVIPKCLSDEARRFFMRQDVPTFDPAVTPTHQELYLFHVEAGMRICDLYALLDKDDAVNKNSLAWEMANSDSIGDYSGPWALQTMGGAGGQTIAGAFSTGTHGGDVAFGPIADMVVAVHLVGPDGQQHWIERTRLRPTMIPMVLTDETKLQAKYPKIIYHRDNDMLNAVVLGAGRFGVIYSVVLRVVRQFALEEFRKQEEWNDVKLWLTGAPIFILNRFVRIDLNPYGSMLHPSRRSCYIKTRLLRALDAAGKAPYGPRGRAERGMFPGQGHPLGKMYNFSSRACSSENWVTEALEGLLHDTEAVMKTAKTVWLAAAAVIVFPLTPPPVRQAALAAQAAAIATMTWAAPLIALLWDIIDHVLPPVGGRFGDTLSTFTNWCAHFDRFDLLRLVFSYVFDKEAETDPSDLFTPAISYAAMDEHDYTNIGCVNPGDSIEIFFDATNPGLVTFIDLVLKRVDELENNNKAFGGYISMRFMSEAEALIGMQLWPRTCSIEIAGLSRVEGTDPFLERVEADAVAYGVPLHWGQRNKQPEIKYVESVWSPMPPLGRLFRWRKALSDLSAHGRYDLFSTEFSKMRGLEITDPIIKSFSVSLREGCAGEATVIKWIAIDNPPETQASVEIVSSLAPTAVVILSSLEGEQELLLPAGRADLVLTLRRPLKDRIYTDQRTVSVRGITPSDNEWKFVFAAETRLVDGVNRWFTEINLFSQSISNKLVVSQIQVAFEFVTSWKMRASDGTLHSFSSASSTMNFSMPMIFNANWAFYSDAPASTPGPSPLVQVTFKLTCTP